MDIDELIKWGKTVKTPFSRDVVPALETLRKRLAESEAEIETLKTDKSNLITAVAIIKATKPLEDRLAAEQEEWNQCSGLLDDALRSIGTLEDQLAAANADIERLRFALADTEALEIGTGERLAVAQLHIKTLREAMEKIGEIASPYRDGVKFNYIADIAQEALSTPQDLSALHAYGKRIADAVEKLTVERCAAKCKKEVVQAVLDSSDERAYNCAVADCVGTIRALPLGQIDIGEL